MKVTEAMIEEFFRNELNEYQEEWVKDYFRQYPEALQQYLTDKSWKDFNSNENLDSDVTGRMFHIIEAGAYGKNTVRKMYYRWAAAAAAVLLVASIGYHFLTNKAATGTGIQMSAIPENKLPEAKSDWKNETNNTGKTIKLSLKDGSLVELAEGSQIHYRESFAPDKRDIYLTGSALFRVGKDKTRPFTVYAGNLHITALGTVFKVVTSGDESKKTEVHLLSGKVVVRPDSMLEKRGIKEIYLDTDQLLLLDKQKFTMTLSPRGENSNPDPRKLAVPALKKVFAFNNESLEDIFKELGADYKIRFVYGQDMLKDMTFTGKFNNQKETLEDFLNTISILNNLTIRQEKNRIYISQ